MHIVCVGLPHLKADSMSSKGILLRVTAGLIFLSGLRTDHKISFIHADHVSLLAAVKGRFRV
jgi:hypothetical protein